jgi:hypothetical protein
VRDEKMLEKLATHDVQDISELFSLGDKCTRAAKGCACHSQPTLEAGKAGKPDADAAAQSGDKNKKKKKKVSVHKKPLAGAPTNVAAAAAATVDGGRGPCGDKRPQQPSGSDEGNPWCPVHNSRCHNMEECREIKNLAEQFCEQ